METRAPIDLEVRFSKLEKEVEELTELVLSLVEEA